VGLEGDKIIAGVLEVKPTISWYVGSNEAGCFWGDNTWAACRKWHDEHKELCNRKGYSLQKLETYPAYTTCDDAALKGMKELARKSVIKARFDIDGSAARVVLTIPTDGIYRPIPQSFIGFGEGNNLLAAAFGGAILVRLCEHCRRRLQPGLTPHVQHKCPRCGTVEGELQVQSAIEELLKEGKSSDS
jgi:phage FluMu protein Com